MSNKSTNHKNHSSLKKETTTYKNNKPSVNKKNTSDSNYSNYYLIPIFIILCIIPFIIRVKIYNTNLSQFLWYAEDDSYADFFLYYKHWIFVGISAIMAIIIACKFSFDRKAIRFLPVFIPLAAFGLLSLLSAIFSEYAMFSFTGSFELFESVFALLGYCLVVYYAFLFINDERDLKKIMNYLVIVAIIMSIFGLFQFVGKDLIGTKTFFHLIVPRELQEAMGYQSNFESNRVYLTLYNPNNVGVYVSLVMPIILVMLFFQKTRKGMILSIIASIGLLISVIGSQSQAGVIGLGVVMVFICVFMWRYLLKRYYITISVGVILVIGVIVLNIVTDQLLFNRLKNIVSSTKTNFALTAMDTEEDHVSLVYNGNKLLVRYVTTQEGQDYFFLMDEKNEMVNTAYDANTNSYLVDDSRFTGISLGFSQYDGVFYIQESGQQFLFTAQTEDGTYYHLNRFGRLDKMKTAPSSVFNGYEGFATNRGYIWSRTIPIMKKYIALGSGPDTFTMVFPQQDYVNFYRYGYPNAIITKPHSMYLQVAVQEGILALLAFLIFYGIYFVSSLRLYIKGYFHNYYAQIGVAIFIGTIGYMVTGLTNDSNISTAPIFWTLIGIGIGVNYKAKPFILEDIKAAKAVKAAKAAKVE